MKILVCDDEPIIVKQISSMILEKYPWYEIFEASGSSEIVEMLQKDDSLNFDVVLMDIMLKNESGINIGAFLDNKLENSKIIFITGCQEKVSEIFFSIKPYGYIDKPISREILYRYLDKIENENVKLNLEYVFPDRGKTYSIKYDDISFVEIQRNKLLIHTVKGVFTISVKIEHFEKEAPKNFVRCHKSFIVNMKYVLEYNRNFFTMITGEMINVSRSKKEETDKRYFMYKGGMI